MKAFPISLALGLLLLAPAVDAANVTTVSIDKFMFAPMEITIAPGDTVAWVNRDQTPHTVAARDHGFVSQALDTGDRYERKFTSEGDFSYVCSLHPFMVGVVHVHSRSQSSHAPAARGH
jgi:plastocyanin